MADDTETSRETVRSIRAIVVAKYVPTTVLVIIAGALAITDRPGWGWFLFAAVMTL